MLPFEFKGVNRISHKKYRKLPTFNVVNPCWKLSLKVQNKKNHVLFSVQYQVKLKYEKPTRFK